MLRELDTRPVPIEPIECSYARNRAPAERPRSPRPGDRVWYRHRPWDATVHAATVREVQNPAEHTDDQNLWHLVRDALGQPVLTGGRPTIVAVADPWPWVLLELDEPVAGSRMYRTWESRVRGSAGWLPLDYEKRPVRLPRQVALRPLEPLMPAHAVNPGRR